MLDSKMIRHADIEYRITEVEKSASLDEEKVKKELYDALLDKKKVIEDLREQLSFRNAALEHEIAQRNLVEDDRRNLALRLEEALCTTTLPADVQLTSTQTIPVAHCTVGSQTLPARRGALRSTHTQTWDPPPTLTAAAAGSRAGNQTGTERLANQVKKLQEQLCELRKQQTMMEKEYEKRLTDLKLQHVRNNDKITKNHISQEQVLGNTVIQLQEENQQLREHIAMSNNNKNMIISSDSDDFNGSRFCCAPGVRRKKKGKKKKGKNDEIPNPYGMHSSQKQGAFWNSSNGTVSDI